MPLVSTISPKPNSNFRSLVRTELRPFQWSLFAWLGNSNKLTQSKQAKAQAEKSEADCKRKRVANGHFLTNCHKNKHSYTMLDITVCLFVTRNRRSAPSDNQGKA
ncbi:unnamed protein product [Ceratitis capitata]|uniref:(Mediterranean fruit fly) hypothetical protein n=1 Tax=Ceratitis capitata TaxID=7213 RepID=A0A811U9X5_CERCA|nr:unnamed protein product [Ceratitis capitata]